MAIIDMNRFWRLVRRLEEGPPLGRDERREFRNLARAWIHLQRALGNDKDVVKIRKLLEKLCLKKPPESEKASPARTRTTHAVNSAGPNRMP